jgi:hypothetical protein
MAAAGQGLDAQGARCSKKICARRAPRRSRSSAPSPSGGPRARTRFVVIDTAPTGHTLLLLDAAEAYHREVLRKPSGSPDAVQRLLPRLRDPEFTTCCSSRCPRRRRFTRRCSSSAICARRYQPFAWVVNQSLTPLTVTDPVLRARGAMKPYLAEVRELTAGAPRSNARMSLWVALCMLVGVALGTSLCGPGGSRTRCAASSSARAARSTCRSRSCIWLMITPMMMRIDLGALPRRRRRPRGLLVTLFVNWLVKPFSMALLGWLFFRHLFSPWIGPAGRPVHRRRRSSWPRRPARRWCSCGAT